MFEEKESKVAAEKDGGGLSIKPMEQFEVINWLGDAVLFFSFTNVAFWMLAAVALIYLVLVVFTKGENIVPSRQQSIAEVLYGFVYKMIEENAGSDAVRYFPLIFTLFLFVLAANILGLLPYSFTTTSHIAVTGTLAILVFVTITMIGFVKNGSKFLGLFWVSSAPLVLRPLLAVIEVISYFVRPLSHSIRLAGNLMAGHAVIKVFAGFVGGVGMAFAVPILAISVIYGLEVLVAAVQAYVFTILTCVYLRDALHPSH